MDLNGLDIEHSLAFAGHGPQRWGATWLGIAARRERGREWVRDGVVGAMGGSGPSLRGWRGLVNGLKCCYGGEPRTRRRAGGGDRLCVTGVTHVRGAFPMG